MTSIARTAVLAVLLVLPVLPAGAASVRDDMGRAVNLRLPVRRIVSLTPSVTENLFAIGAGRAVVGVTTADDYPAAVRNLPKTGDFMRPSYERIRALRPDIILLDSATIDRGTVANLEARTRVPVFVLRSRTFDDVARHLALLGRLTGSRSGASRAIAEMKAKASTVAGRIRGKPRVSVFVQTFASPLYTAGPGTYIDDLIRRAGGTNIVKGTNPWPAYSKESVLAADPDHYVIAGGGPMGQNGATLPPPLDRLSAVRKGNVHRIPADLLLRPTPRLADGLVLLSRALHP